MATSTSVVIPAAAVNTPSITLLAVFLEMRPCLPEARARLMRWAEVSSPAGAWLALRSMAYPFLILESTRTMPTSAAEMMNRTTPMPNRAVRCRPEE